MKPAILIFTIMFSLLYSSVFLSRYYNYHRFLHYGGPDGELSASMRYLSQRYSMPYSIAKGTLTDIGSEVAKCSSLLPFFHKKRLPAGRKNANKNICYLEIISSFYTGRPVTAWEIEKNSFTRKVKNKTVLFSSCQKQKVYCLIFSIFYLLILPHRKIKRLENKAKHDIIPLNKL